MIASHKIWFVERSVLKRSERFAYSYDNCGFKNMYDSGRSHSYLNNIFFYKPVTSPRSAEGWHKMKTTGVQNKHTGVKM